MDKGYKRPTAKARELRSNATDAERRLWPCLNARKIHGVRFNRQVPIAPFICDFVSRGARLVIELEGGQHGWRTEGDAHRTRYIESEGFQVIRFWNNDVIENLDGVVSEIERALRNMPASGEQRPALFRPCRGHGRPDAPNPSRKAGGEAPLDS